MELTTEERKIVEDAKKKGNLDKDLIELRDICANKELIGEERKEKIKEKAKQIWHIYGDDFVSFMCKYLKESE